MEEEKEETDEDDPEEEKKSVDDIAEQRLEPKDEGKGAELDVRADGDSKDNEEVNVHLEKARRHKELYGRCPTVGREGPMSLEDSGLGLTLDISLAQHFLWGCGASWLKRITVTNHLH